MAAVLTMPMAMRLRNRIQDDLIQAMEARLLAQADLNMTQERVAQLKRDLEEMDAYIAELEGA